MLKNLFNRIQQLPWWGKGIVGVATVGLTLGGGYIALAVYSQTQSNSVSYIRRWFDDPSSRADLITPYTGQTCGNAPFMLPTGGFIGLLWNDPGGPYNILRRHSGLDIFGDGRSGEIPVHAAYDGFLTRLDNWVSAVIIRHDDPLQAGRTIWTYYTHMASRDGESYIADRFPQGVADVPVKQGELIGYQGEYNGDSLRTVGLHLHFSIVLSDSDGSFKNESDAGNTLDPSPYLGLTVNIEDEPDRPIRCNVD
jgi:murein DD-endopeptidase MepM/ murein hydrolase activator NlpD